MNGEGFVTFGVDEDLDGPSTSTGIRDGGRFKSTFPSSLQNGLTPQPAAKEAVKEDGGDDLDVSVDSDTIIAAEVQQDAAVQEPADEVIQSQENLIVPAHRTRIRLPHRSDFVIGATIAKIISPSMFWVHLQTSVAEQMDQWIGDVDLLPLGMYPYKFDYALAPFQYPPNSGQYVYRRARVMSHAVKMLFTGDVICRVFFIDWAETDWVTCDSLRQMPQGGNVVHIPWQTVCCGLQGLSPVGEAWPVDVVNAFESYLKDKRITISAPPSAKGDGQNRVPISNKEPPFATPVDVTVQAANRGYRVNVAVKLFIKYPSLLRFERSKPANLFTNYDIDDEQAMAALQKILYAPAPEATVFRRNSPEQRPETVNSEAPTTPRRRKIVPSSIRDAPIFRYVEMKPQDCAQFMVPGSESVLFNIKEIVDPWTIFARPVHPHNEMVKNEEFKRFCDEIDSFYTFPTNRVPIDFNELNRSKNNWTKFFAIAKSPDRSQYQYARVLVEDSKFVNYNRAEIQRASGNRYAQSDLTGWGEGTLEVQFMDFGGVESRMLDEIYQITENFACVPYYCWRLCFKHLKPAGLGKRDGQFGPLWSEAAKNRLVQLLPKYRTLKGSICPFQMDESVQMEVNARYPKPVALFTDFALFDIDGERLPEELDQQQLANLDDADNEQHILRVSVCGDLVEKGLAEVDVLLSL